MRVISIRGISSSDVAHWINEVNFEGSNDGNRECDFGEDNIAEENVWDSADRQNDGYEEGMVWDT